eukprot:TRINITY_DN43710_c0_g1_i1.p4 TRINITY_DN43710_c0_g1~~TRINITY_DN43710_c0_g1_i1.p4  ORF type:complete len:216 (+),score=77.77 TRINITY_DN43710_c0_g1_i1:872-1519(+)
MSAPRKSIRAAALLLAGSLLLPLAAVPAQAQPGGGRGHGHGQGRYDGPRHYDRMPPGHHRYDYRGKPYYRHHGGYYRPYRGGFVWVAPPVGLFVAGLPLGFRTILVGGLPYYFHGGVYYRSAPGGYVVVSAPVVSETVTSAPAAPASGTVVVLAEALNLRSGPGMNFSVLTVVSQATALELVGRSGGWLKVRAPGGTIGWVARQFTSDNNPPASG